MCHVLGSDELGDEKGSTLILADAPVLAVAHDSDDAGKNAVCDALIDD